MGVESVAGSPVPYHKFIPAVQYRSDVRGREGMGVHSFMICFKLFAKIWGDSLCAILIILLLAKKSYHAVQVSHGTCAVWCGLTAPEHQKSALHGGRGTKG